MSLFYYMIWLLFVSITGVAMNFQGMGDTGWFMVLVAVVLVVLFGMRWFVRLRDWMDTDKESRGEELRYELVNSSIVLLICLTASAGIVILAAKNNSGYQDQLLKEEAQREEESKKQEAAAGARYAELEKAKADIQSQGLKVLWQDFQNTGHGLVEMEVTSLEQGYEGCTYIYTALKNPAGKYVLNVSTGKPSKTDSRLVFPEDGGNAYTQGCPAKLDLSR